MDILFFTILQLVNVILSTFKSVATVKGGKWTAVLMNSIYYGFYTFVIKQISSLDNVWILALITLLTNFLGVFLSLTILEKTRKDRLWLFKITVKKEEHDNLVSSLHIADLKFITLNSDWNERNAIDIYAYTKEESKKLKDIIKKYPSIKWCTIETNMKGDI